MRIVVIAAVAVVCGLVSVASSAAQGESAALIQRGSRLAYDLDHDEALTVLRRAVALAPDDPRTHRTLANVLWLNILFRRGAVTVDHYLGSFTRSQVDLKKPPPDIDAEFRAHMSRALDLAEQRAAAAPGSAQAHYDLGAALALRASYVASVEGRLMAGFNAARGAYDEHEKALKLDPSRADAELVVGTYRYVVSTLSLPARMVAYVAGFGGGRERGIRMLEEAAARGLDNRSDALFALVLVYNRERRYDDALRALQELRRSHPRNRLVLLETGSTALRAGRLAEADAALSEGLAALAADRRPRMPGEEALWHYKRGAARAAAGRLDSAVGDLLIAVGPDAAEWVSGRAHVEMGRIALKRGDRSKAAEEARQGQSLCERGNDPICVADARTVLRSSNGR